MRFPEFKENWLKRKFSEIADFYKGCGISKEQLSSDGNECILYGELYTTYKNETINKVISKTDIDTTGLFLSKKNDVIIPASGETPIDIATACCINKDNILLGSDLNVIRLKFDNGSFISCQLNGKRKFDIAKIAQGASIVHLHNDDLKKLIIYTPIMLDEEEKIINLFNFIDQKIETQSKIIKEHKSLKKLIENICSEIINIILLLIPSRMLKIIFYILKLIMTIIKEVKNMVKRKNISEVSNLWKEEKRSYIKKSSYSAYLLLLENHLLPYFGVKTEIEEKDVQQFVLKKLNEGLSQKSIKDMIIVLKMIIRYGVKQKLLDYSEIEIKFPSENERTELEILTRQDHKKLLDYLEKYFTFKNLGIYICLSTGMRIGEICGLRWSDIDCDDGIIKVRRTLQRVYIITENGRHTEIVIDTPKTKNSIRDIPMTSDLLRLIKPIKKIVKEDFYVVTNDEKPTEPRTYRNYYKKLLKKLQIHDLKFHGLRHSFATRCIECKCDYKTVSVILGHSNISTTLNLYVHPNLEQKKKCVNQMFRSLR